MPQPFPVFVFAVTLILAGLIPRYFHKSKSTYVKEAEMSAQRIALSNNMRLSILAFFLIFMAVPMLPPEGFIDPAFKFLAFALMCVAAITASLNLTRDLKNSRSFDIHIIIAISFYALSLIKLHTDRDLANILAIISGTLVALFFMRLKLLKKLKRVSAENFWDTDLDDLSPLDIRNDDEVEIVHTVEGIPYGETVEKNQLKNLQK